MKQVERLNDREEALRQMQDGFQSKMWTALPGIVQSYDAAEGTVSVQPAVNGQQLLIDGTYKIIPMPLLIHCPVLYAGGGGFLMTFPIAEGDECVVVFSSRSIDAWWQSGGAQGQIEYHMHDLSDGFAFIGPFSQPRLPENISASVMQLRKGDNVIFETDGTSVDFQVPVNVLGISVTEHVHEVNEIQAGDDTVTSEAPS